MVRVVVLDDYHRAFSGTEPIARLREAAEVAIYEKPFESEDALVAALSGVEVIIANRERTHFTRSLLARLPELRLISNTGGHFYHVDVDAATLQGVLLCNAAGGSSQGVVELTIAMMISLARRLHEAHAAMQRGEWPVQLAGCLEGKVVGILGLGRIGSGVARAARALTCDVIAWGPTLTEKRAAASGVRRRELDEVMREADFVSIHLALSSLSRGLIGRERLALMKPSAYLVNTARGAIVDESALIEVLDERRIAGAGLDVFVEEPLPVHSPLRSLDNVLLSPHAGWTTHEAYERWIEMVVENIFAYLAGSPVRVHAPGHP